MLRSHYKILLWGIILVAIIKIGIQCQAMKIPALAVLLLRNSEHTPYGFQYEKHT